MQGSPHIKLHVIDALGPFFVNTPKTGTINWSKVPFSHIESNGRLSEQMQAAIITNFETYLKKVSALGYDAISIDDLAHMVTMPFYSDATKRLIDDYRHLYERIFYLAKQRDMRVYVNTDYLFMNDEIEKQLAEGRAAQDLFAEVIERAFTALPQIDGVILRIGENDGKDVTGTFLSKLFMRTPRSANKLLQRVLPIFEKHHKRLVFRTWTVGAYKIGDLIWNEQTYDKVFGSISSEALIISMKFGDTDFMRHLELNPLFFHGRHKKIIELQTRREWEGMGTIPSFVGWDYEKYLRALTDNDSVVGIHVWCQTGGWAKSTWNNLTYLQGSSLWNELNTEVTIAIACGSTTEQAITQFCKSRNINDPSEFTRLLEHSEVAIKKGLYIADIAQKPLYFRRSRIPPMLWLTWDRIHLPKAVVHLHRILLPRQSSFAQDGTDAIAACDAMIKIAINMKLTNELIESLRFEKDTLTILNEIRRYIAGDAIDSGLEATNASIDDYTKSHPQHYSIDHLSRVKSRRLHKGLLNPVVRDSSLYRRRDKVFLRTSRIQARLLKILLRRSGSHLEDQSMGIEILFK